MRRIGIGAVLLGLLAAALGGCSGDGADTTTTTTVPPTRATTIGAVTHEMNYTAMEFEPLTSPLLAVELEDGTETVATATADIFEEAGMGADVLSSSGERVTWGGDYAIYQDTAPDTVLLEEGGEGEWRVVSVGE